MLANAFDRCHAATFVWNGGGADANWSTPANWSGGLAPANDGTAVVILTGINRLSPNVDAAWSISSLSFTNTAGAFALGGSLLTVGAGGVTNSSANTQVINNAINLGASQTWNAVSNTLSFNGIVNNGGNLLTVSGNFNSAIGGIINGTGGLTKTGTGTNTLTAANTYSGLTTISAGVVNIQNAAALGSTNSGTVVASGAVLQLQGGILVTNEPLTLSGSGLSSSGALRSLTNDNTWGGVITLAAAATIGCDTNSLTLPGGIVNSTFLTTFTNGGTINMTGTIGNGTGGLTKTGPGTLFLTTSNSYGGLTTVSAGVVNIQNSFALGTTSSGTTVSSGAVLQQQGGFDVSGETLSLNGSGVGGIGAFRSLSGSNSWSGLITLAGSTTIDADAGTLNLTANIVNSTSTLTVTNTGTVILSGALGSGTGGLTKVGTGTLIINNANNFTGATTITGGTIQFGASGTQPPVSAVTVNASGTLDLNSLNESILSLAGAGSVTLGSGTLTVNNTAAATFSGVMSGTGGLTESGTGTLTMSGVNTFTGNTVINSGAISIKADNNLGATNGSINLNGGTLTTSATVTSARSLVLGASGGTLNLGGALTLSGIVSGPGALNKIGTKTLTMTGTNTYLGGTTNGAGIITIGSDFALGNTNGPVTFSASATLTTTASFTSSRNFILNAGTATFTAGTGFTNTLNGVISGVGAMTQSGAGVLVLGGNNTFTNLLTISKGTVRLGGNERLADLMPLFITSSSATFDLNGFSETIGSLASSAAGKVTLSNGFLTVGGNNLSRTNSTVISGNGGFTKVGTGTLIFTGANTYTNTTTVAAGTLQLGASERIANTSPLVISNGATFNMTNFSETVASLAGAGSVILGTGTLTVGNSGTANFSGAISGTGAFTKVGGGTQIFSGTNSYSGATTVSAGILQVNGNSAGSAVTIASAATLSGNGTVGAIAINSGATNSPGTSAPGTLSSAAETWPGGGNYVWEINNATGAKGGSSGWDWLNISGALTITANSGSKFTIKIVSLTLANASGQATNFDNSVTYVWPIATASGGINGFSAANFNLDATAFQNSLGAGAFSLSQSGNDLNLIFTTASQATIKSVQTGTFSSSGAGTNTIALGAGVNPTNAFLIFNSRHNSSAPGGSMIRGRLANSNNVEFVRVTSETSTMNVSWSVVEYSAGVRVQRGEISQTNTVLNVPLATLSATNQAFVTWSKTPEITALAFDDTDPIIGDITATTNLQFRAGAIPSLPVSYPVISWQVVEFTHPASINVQKGSVTNMTATNLTGTAALNLAVDPNGTFVLAGYRTSGSGSSIGARMLRAQLASANSIAFDRSISGAPDDITEIAWQAVQLKDGSLAQSGTVNFAGGVAETNVVLSTSINTNRAIAFATAQPAGGQNTGRSPSTGNVLGVGSATLAMTSLSQLTLDRNNTSDMADIAWTVVGLGPSSILAPASGGSAISADTKGGVYTSLTGPVYTEVQNGNIGNGTISLNAPSGFIFDTNATLPTILITRVGGSGANSLNVNGVASGTSVAMTTITTTNLSFTITSASSAGVTCSLTWQNVRVRPSAGTPLASGNITSSGTSTVQGLTTNSTSWGFLNEVVGAATKLAIATAPSSTAVAGVDFAQQPVIQVQDQFGNLRMADNSTTVTVTNTGSTVLEGTTNITVAGGVAAFAGLDYTVAETIKLGFVTTGLTVATSGNIVVSPAPASQVTVKTQPSASVLAGAAFPQQPLVRVEDVYGNLRSSDNSTVVTAVLDQGSGSLLGTLTATAVSGVATFANLNYQVAETITIDFTSGSLDLDTSTAVTVNPAAANQLVIQTQPSAVATAGVPFAQQPAIQIQDQFGNLCVTNNSTVVTASRNAGTGVGTLQGTVNVTAVSGIVTFANLAHNVAGTISVDFNSSGLATATSSSISITPASATRLAFSTQPGSATVGSVFGIQPALVTQDALGNNSVLGLAANQIVTVTLSSGTGTLQGTATRDIGSAAGNGAITYANLEIDSAGSKQLTASASGLTNAVSASFTVAQGSQTIAFGALANKNYGDVSFNLAASASSSLPITFSIASGAASVSGSNVTLLGAGNVTVRASQLGNTDYLAATSVDQSFTVSKAVLTVAADPKTRIFGAANPTFSASYSGFVNGDSAGVVSGAPAFSTTATNTSSVAGSPYAITVTNGTLSAASYSFTFVSGQLTITPANSALAVSTSANPSPTGSNVTFTATLTAVLPGNGTPTGTVQFLADGSALGSPAAISGGVATIGSASLSHGSHAITARFAGDGNFFGSTNSLPTNQVINSRPIAVSYQLQRFPQSGAKVRITTLLTNDSDPDGDTISFVSVSSISGAGGVISRPGSWLAYVPPSGFTNADSFSYIIADSGGLQTTGIVSLAVSANNAFSQNIYGTESLAGGAVRIHFSGIPGTSYSVQYSVTNQSPVWQTLGTATADSIGQFDFTDTPPTNLPPRFYRSTYP